MAIKDIIDKINSDADSEVKKIIVKSETESGEIVSRANEQALKLRELILEDGRQNAEKAKARIITLALLDGKKSVLHEKQSILGEVYKEVEKHIRGLNDKGYRSLMKRLIMEGCKTKEVEVIVGKNDKDKIDGKLVDEVNKALGSKCEVKLVDEQARIADGFILRYGKMEIDNSVESIVKSLKEDTIDRIASSLYK